MYNFSFSKDGFYFKRVNRTTAKRCYNNGLTVIFNPCKLNPNNNYFSLAMEINKENINCNYQTFETIENEYTFYNCNNETGKYISFFVPVVNGSYDYKYIEV